MLKEVEQYTEFDSTSLHYLLCPVIRAKLPIQMWSVELCHFPQNDNETVTAYLLMVRQLWKDRPGEEPAASNTIERLFRAAVEASLPSPVQTTLKPVMGLPSLTYTVWAAHVTHYIINLGNEIREGRSWQTQLARLQLKEMRNKVNQNKACATVNTCSVGFRSGDMLDQSISFTLSFFSKAVVVLEVHYVWGRYHGGIP